MYQNRSSVSSRCRDKSLLTPIETILRSRALSVSRASAERNVIGSRVDYAHCILRFVDARRFVKRPTRNLVGSVSQRIRMRSTRASPLAIFVFVDFLMLCARAQGPRPSNLDIESSGAEDNPCFSFLFLRDISRCRDYTALIVRSEMT